MAKLKVSIEYCTSWNYTPRAVSLADELLNTYTPSIESVTLIPSSGGRFEVIVGDTLVFSKKTIGRHAEAGEVTRLLEETMGITAQPFTKK